MCCVCVSCGRCGVTATSRGLTAGDPATGEIMWDCDCRPSDATFLSLQVSFGRLWSGGVAQLQVGASRFARPQHTPDAGWGKYVYVIHTCSMCIRLDTRFTAGVSFCGLGSQPNTRHVWHPLMSPSAGSQPQQKASRESGHACALLDSSTAPQPARLPSRLPCVIPSLLPCVIPSLLPCVIPCCPGQGPLLHPRQRLGVKLQAPDGDRGIQGCLCQPQEPPDAAHEVGPRLVGHWPRIECGGVCGWGHMHLAVHPNLASQLVEGQALVGLRSVPAQRWWFFATAVVLLFGWRAALPPMLSLDLHVSPG